MTLLREVIEIPTEVRAGDFVLRLTDGVEHAEATIRDYVVTRDIARAFDSALGLVENALLSGRSQAAFLHGSFGSGKSHFMAVLHTLLGGSRAARRLPELAEPIARHDAVLQHKRFLRLAYHLIGARSLEHALFGGYLQQVRRLHPDAPLPALHQSDRLLEDAHRIRERLGERFFEELNGGAGASGVWGAFAGRWTPERYARAAAAPADDAERGRLVDALARTFFTSFAESADYVEIDAGLRAIAEHAHSLGYDAVVLFLDELVLWLVSHLANREFVTTEAAKVAKLVESADARRPIPLVSFIARQRDLNEFLGEAVPGAQQEAISDTLRWWDDRFQPIPLGDENLPYIAQRRLLRPRDERAQGLLDDAFADLDRRPEVWSTLLDGFNTDERHRGSDEAAFRMTYPFSPALVSTLRAVSSVMQRERTALKVMQQVLVEQRDELTISDVVPVGDVFDHVVEGQQALDPAMERQFAAARRLYRQKLRPLLLQVHALSEEEAQRQGYRSPFRADDRLVKTLLIAALIPAVPALRDLDASRLTHLNHGTIRSPIPYQEVSTVVAKLRQWQAQAPEIMVGDDPRNPSVSIRLAEVDYQAVLDRVRSVDSNGARRRLLKELVWESLGIHHRPDLFGIQRHHVVWRASRRELEVAFGNVRDPEDVPDEVLDNRGEAWRLVVDYPFDEEGRGRAEDRARLDLIDARARTVAWLPRHLTLARQEDLGDLVKLNHLLAGSGERFDANADHLSATDRAQARAILDTMRTSLRARLLDVVQQAYGARAPVPGDVVDEGPGGPDVLVSLDPSLRLQEPVGATLGDALTNLVDQLCSHAYPDHPRFQPSTQALTAGELRKVLDHVLLAHQEPNGRVPVPNRSDREVLRRICNPLELGEMHENAYVLNAGNFPWRTRVAQEMYREGGGGPTTVGRLRRWLDPQGRRGLERAVADLLVLAWAVLGDRAWYQHGAAIPMPELGRLQDDMELREQPLPAIEEWETAVRRAAELFGVSAGSHLTAPGLHELAGAVRRAAAELAGPARDLVAELTANADPLGLDPTSADNRLATARAAATLVEGLAAARDDLALVVRLASARHPAADQVVGRSLARAQAVVQALRRAQWQLMRAIADVRDERQTRARRVLEDLAAAGAAEEFEVGLEAALEAAQREAAQLLARPVAAPAAPSAPAAPAPSRVSPAAATPTPRVEAPAPPASPERGSLVVATPDEVLNAMVPLEAFLRRHPGRRVRVSWELEP
jgi:hypothetical protein